MSNAFIRHAERKLVEMEFEKTRLEEEALEIFKGVVMEWESDPMSVQCFDLRVVERAKYIRALLRDLDQRIEKAGGGSFL